MYRSCLPALMVLMGTAAAAQTLGVVTSGGSFTLDESKVTGNGTLFEGSRIETETASSQIQLNNGARILLGGESKGVVYLDRIVLERGSGRFESYTVEASTLRIEPQGPNASAEVAVRNANIAGPGTVRVAAIKGQVRVSTLKGVVLMTVQTGRTFDFATPDPLSAPPVSVSGPPSPAAPAGKGTTAPAAASAGAGAKVATVAAIAAGASTAAGIAVVKADDQPAISPSTR